MSLLQTRRMLINTKKGYVFNFKIHFEQMERIGDYPSFSYRYAFDTYNVIKTPLDWLINPLVQQTWVVNNGATRAEIQIRCWNGTGGKPHQTIDYVADGTPTVTTSVSDDIKTIRLVYNRPAKYNIEVWVGDVCNNELIITGGGARPLKNPYVKKIYLGKKTGTVRVQGSFLGAPDRAILKLGDTEVLDTRYRGALYSSSSPPKFYQSLISAAYVDQLGYSSAAAMTASEVFPCTSCGVPTGTYNTRLGEFDLTFEKTTEDRVVTVEMYSPIATDWRIRVYCPVDVSEMEVPLFGYDFKSARDSTTSTVAPSNFSPDLIVSDISRSVNLDSSTTESTTIWRAWGHKGWEPGKGFHDQQNTYNEYFGFSVKNNSAQTVSITGCKGPFLSRYDGGGQAGSPLSAAFIYNKTNSNWNDDINGYTVISNFKIDTNEWGGSSYIYKPFDCTSIISAALEANPINIASGETAYFRFVPYGSTSTNGRLAFYDWELLGDATDFAFFGGFI